MTVVREGDRVRWEDSFERTREGTVMDVLSVQATVRCTDKVVRFVFFNEPTLELLDG